MKPVGLTNPAPERRAWAVVQLRQDNVLGTLYNIVGFQTKLRHADQVRVFRTIPGLEQAEFARLGGLHRNTFINSPKLLDQGLRLKSRAAISALPVRSPASKAMSKAPRSACSPDDLQLPSSKAKCLRRRRPTTALGALVAHITGGADAVSFQPMNVNFGLFPPLPAGVITRSNRGEKKPLMAKRALADLGNWLVPAEEAAE